MEPAMRHPSPPVFLTGKEADPSLPCERLNPRGGEEKGVGPDVAADSRKTPGGNRQELCVFFIVTDRMCNVRVVMRSFGMSGLYNLTFCSNTRRLIT